jgi:CRP-like cAMP-binding protein
LRVLKGRVQPRLEKADVLKIIRAFEFFATFTDEELNLLFEYSKIERFNDGQVVISEGATDNAFYLILKGGATIRKKTCGTPLSRDINILGRGDCVGEMAIISGNPRSADVVARSDTFMLKILPHFLADSTNLATVAIQMKLYRNFCKSLCTKLTTHSAELALFMM